MVAYSSLLERISQLQFNNRLLLFVPRSGLRPETKEEASWCGLYDGKISLEGSAKCATRSVDRDESRNSCSVLQLLSIRLNIYISTMHTNAYAQIGRAHV